MLRDIKVYLGLVVGITNARVVPFDWRAITQELQETLARCQTAVGAAYSLAASREALQGLDAALQQFYQGVQDRTISDTAANDAIRRLARILVPINHTLQPRFGHDPASAMPALPGLDIAHRWATLPEDLQGFALTQIRRGENKLLGALRQARRELQLALPS